MVVPRRASKREGRHITLVGRAFIFCLLLSAASAQLLGSLLTLSYFITRVQEKVDNMCLGSSLRWGPLRGLLSLTTQLGITENTSLTLAVADVMLIGSNSEINDGSTNCVDAIDVFQYNGNNWFTPLSSLPAPVARSSFSLQLLNSILPLSTVMATFTNADVRNLTFQGGSGWSLTLNGFPGFLPGILPLNLTNLLKLPQQIITTLGANVIYDYTSTLDTVAEYLTIQNRSSATDSASTLWGAILVSPNYEYTTSGFYWDTSYLIFSQSGTEYTFDLYKASFHQKPASPPPPPAKRRNRRLQQYYDYYASDSNADMAASSGCARGACRQIAPKARPSWCKNGSPQYPKCTYSCSCSGY